MTDTLRILLEEKIVAILRGIPEGAIQPVAEALAAGGIRCLEVTFDQSSQARTEKTLHAIRLLRETMGDRLCIGAGTVMSAKQVQQAYDAGAQYIISPNTNEAVIRRTKELGLVSIPGAMTPSEIDYACRCGADIVKLFPADILGLAYIKAVLAPMRHVRLMATGGITLENGTAFLAAGSAGLGIGSCLVDKNLIAMGRFDEMTEVARQFCLAAKK